jgi:hypothetical protein
LSESRILLSALEVFLCVRHPSGCRRHLFVSRPYLRSARHGRARSPRRSCLLGLIERLLSRKEVAEGTDGRGGNRSDAPETNRRSPRSRSRQGTEARSRSAKRSRQGTERSSGVEDNRRAEDQGGGELPYRQRRTVEDIGDLVRLLDQRRLGRPRLEEAPRVNLGLEVDLLLPAERLARTRSLGEGRLVYVGLDLYGNAATARLEGRQLTPKSKGREVALNLYERGSYSRQAVTSL